MLTLTIITTIQAQITIGTETQVNTYTADDQYRQKVAYDNAGNYIIVWASVLQDSSGEGIYAQRYDMNGNTIGTEFLVNTTTADDQYDPDVVFDSNGNFVIVWISAYQDGDDDGIFFQRFNASGIKLGSEVQVNQNFISIQVHPTIDMAPNGNFAVSWISFDPNTGTDDIMVRLFDASGNAVSSDILVFKAACCQFAQTDIAMCDNGNFVITYNHLDNSGRGVFAQLFDSSGAPLTAIFPVNTFTTNDQDFADVDMSPNGMFVITWSSWDQDSSDYGIYAQRFDTLGNPVGSEIWVNTDYTWSRQGKPVIAMDDTGNFTIVWASWWNDGDGNAVKAKRFLADGTPIGPEFQVNTTTLNNQEEPKVAMTSTGEFIVVWQSWDQDGSNNGVYFQRYSSAIPSYVEDYNLSDHAFVFPNPVKEIANVYLDNEISGNIDVTIFDISGKIIEHNKFEKMSPSCNYKINMNGLMPGTYIITLKNNEHIAHYRVIKQ